MSTHQPTAPVARPTLRAVNGYSHAEHAASPKATTATQPLRRLRAGSAPAPEPSQEDSRLIDAVRRAAEVKAAYASGLADGQRAGLQTRATVAWWQGAMFGAALVAFAWAVAQGAGA